MTRLKSYGMNKTLGRFWKASNFGLIVVDYFAILFYSVNTVSDFHIME